MPNGHGEHQLDGQMTVSSTKSWKTSFMMGTGLGAFSAIAVAFAIAIGMCGC